MLSTQKIHKVSYQIHKAKPKYELTPSLKKKKFFSYYVMFPLSFRTYVFDHRIM